MPSARYANTPITQISNTYHHIGGRASCATNMATYSNELNAAFLYGLPSFGGFTSLLLGHSSGDRDISRSDTPFFWGDIPHTGTVLLGGPKGFAIYDGQTITPCMKDSSKYKAATPVS